MYIGVSRTIKRCSSGANSGLHRSFRRYASSLVIGELSGGIVSQGSLAAITAAKKLGGEVSLLIAGSNIGDSAKKAASIDGVSKILVLDSDIHSHKIAENISAALLSVVKEGYTHVLTPSSNFGKNFLPRLAALVDSSPLSDVIDVIDTETFKRPMYAGNAIATVKMTDTVKFILVRATVFDKASTTGGTATILPINADPASKSTTTFISENAAKSTRPDLATSRVVISGGRGMKNGENFGLLEALADKLGGAVGASRAAVDAGFVPNDYQVGQTGKVVAPDLYIAVGISGAIQHLSGMKDSKTIVAINKDKEAPIFQVADYGLVDDLFKVIPELNSKL